MSRTKNGLIYTNMPQLWLEEFRNVAALFPPIPPTGYASKKRVQTAEQRIVQAIYSDLHYGTDLTSEDHLLAYSNREECRATAKVVHNLLEYKTDKRDRTTALLHFCGDDFAGQLGHDDRAVAELELQLARAAHIEAQVISLVASAFPRVVIGRSWGNHGRNTLRHRGRADNFKWLNFEFHMWLVVQALCRNFTNVTWHTDRSGYGYEKVFDWQIFRTHGDTILGAKPNSTEYRRQLAEINSSPLYRGYNDVVVQGHWHTGEQFSAAHTECFVSPPLLPPDGFGQTHGHLTAAGQWIFETTAKYPVGDIRKIRITVDDYADSQWDGLITPWDKTMVFGTTEVK